MTTPWHEQIKDLQKRSLEYCQEINRILAATRAYFGGMAMQNTENSAKLVRIGDDVKEELEATKVDLTPPQSVVDNLPLPLIHSDFTLCGLKEIPKTPAEMMAEEPALMFANAKEVIKDTLTEVTPVNKNDHDRFADALKTLNDYMEDAGMLHPDQEKKLESVFALLKEKATAPVTQDRYVVYRRDIGMWLQGATQGCYPTWAEDFVSSREFDSEEQAVEFMSKLDGLVSAWAVLEYTPGDYAADFLARHFPAGNGKAAVAEVLRRERALAESAIYPYWVITSGPVKNWFVGDHKVEDWVSDFNKATRFKTQEDAISVYKARSFSCGKVYRVEEVEGCEPVITVEEPKPTKKYRVKLGNDRYVGSTPSCPTHNRYTWTSENSKDYPPYLFDTKEDAEKALAEIKQTRCLSFYPENCGPENCGVEEVNA